MLSVNPQIMERNCVLLQAEIEADTFQHIGHRHRGENQAHNPADNAGAAIADETVYVGAASMNRQATTSTASMTAAVCACSVREYDWFSVISTAASMAPGLAMEGTASGKMAVSCPLRYL